MSSQEPVRALRCLCLVVSLGAGVPASTAGVMLSGYLDIGLYRDFARVSHVGTLQRSNIALSGEEDLEGGLRLTFRLSHRLELDTGAVEGAEKNPFWHDEATVGLRGDAGTLRVGRALDVIHANAWAFDPWDNFNRIASPAWQLWHSNYVTDRVSNQGAPEPARLSDGVFYDSPQWHGLTLQASGSPERSATAGGGGGHALGMALGYQHAGAQGLLAHARNRAGDRDTFLGLKTHWIGVTWMVGYDHSRHADVRPSTGRALTLGASRTQGPWTLKLGGGRLVKDAGASRFLGLGLDYGFSKRTVLSFSAGHLRPPSRVQHALGLGLTHRF
ncbi:porin [Inhella gelatinilytica]|uniref:Porin n=1 Tax=Inhella gelatinilytica TaxID=2795030 RepID=A0A931IZW8_9BURK|nr:porin [Inhella gelatinilytica]MBH9552856.1 porin [Inhella gelatinilytica]